LKKYNASQISAIHYLLFCFKKTLLSSNSSVLPFIADSSSLYLQSPKWFAMDDVKMQSKSSKQVKVTKAAIFREQEEIKNSYFFSTLSDSLIKKDWLGA
jgi:hypothetical protein